MYVLTLEDKHRFSKSRMVGAYLGLRPRKSTSGSDDPQLRITKAGDPFLRRLLVNGAHYVMGPFGPDTDLRRWGLELAKRGGKNAKKRAVIAVARKLAVLLHRLWVTGEVYEPTGYRRAAARDARSLKATEPSSSASTVLSQELPSGRLKHPKPPRPGDCDRRCEPSSSAFRCQRPFGCGPHHAPGRDGGPSSSANESQAVGCFETPKTRLNEKIVDAGWPPHESGGRREGARRATDPSVRLQRRVSRRPRDRGRPRAKCRGRLPESRAHRRHDRSRR